MSINTSRFRTFALCAAAAAALTLGLAACGSSDSDGAATSTTAADAASTTTTSTTSTTLPDDLPGVSEVYAPPVAETGSDVTASVYLSITGGKSADQLTGVSVASDWADSAALVPDELIDLVPGETVDLTDKGAHIELTGLKKALELNKPFSITLEFRDAPEQTVQGAVRPISGDPLQD